jgi:hypothetical protein
MRVVLDDMDLAVSEVECLSMDIDRSLGKIQHCWESINLHRAGVDHVLLTTINANFLDKIVM